MADLHPWQRRMLDRAGIDPAPYKRKDVRPHFVGRRAIVTLEIASMTPTQFDVELRRDLATSSDAGAS